MQAVFNFCGATRCQTQDIPERLFREVLLGPEGGLRLGC